jgi:hypothetical protein
MVTTNVGVEKEKDRADQDRVPEAAINWNQSTNRFRSLDNAASTAEEREELERHPPENSV